MLVEEYALALGLAVVAGSDVLGGGLRRCTDS